MLSSKKSTLISCLLNSLRITSDANLHNNSTLRRAPSRTTGDLQVANCSQPTLGLLWRLLARCCSADASCASDREDYPYHQRTSSMLQETKKLLQSLSKCELRHLWEAIQSGGRKEGECVLVQLPHTKTSSSRHRSAYCNEQTTDQSAPMVCQQHPDNHPLNDIDSRLLLSLRWRWPNLDTDHLDYRQIRPLPCCHHYTLGHKSWRHIKQHHSVCINPFHWAQLTALDYSLEDVSSGQAESLVPMPADSGLIERDSLSNRQYYYPMPPSSSSPPPSYSEADADNDALPFVEIACNRHSPLSPEPHVRNNFKWCRVAYWEFRERVGESLSFSSNSVNLTMDATVGDSDISLQSLFKSRRPLPDVAKTRNKIGNGVSIFRDADNSVWLYNRSSFTVFVSSRIFLSQSPFLQCGSPAVVMKVAPGHVIKAYDLAIAHRLRALLNPSTHKSPDYHSFSFSFVKGFGPNYSRQDILQCPCWVEVFLDLTTPAALTETPNA